MFLSQIGDGNFDFNNIRLFENKGNEVQSENSNEDIHIKNFLPISKPKTLCWMCYKIILLENSLRFSQIPDSCEYSSKQFCGKECLDKYTQENFVIISFLFTRLNVMK